jgi:SAM-dependent methyltransferase
LGRLHKAVVAKDVRFIEAINACGPFNHSHWQGKGITVSHEDGLAGRGDLLVKKIREILRNAYSAAQMRRMTLADVGCYDGWLLHHLSDLPFKKLVGIEPREKNIRKGKDIRKLLGIKTRVNFRKGNIESLGRERFDVVLCVGVLHHVEALSVALKELDRITRSTLVLSSICMPSRHLTEEMRRDIEPKDVIYQTKTLCGFTANKYESSYYDGSAAETAVVSIPSIETLSMHFDLLGYDARVAVTPLQFSRARRSNARSFDEVLFSCVRKTSRSVDRSLAEYEEGMMRPLRRSLIEPIYRRLVLQEKNVGRTVEARSLEDYINRGTAFPDSMSEHTYDREILNNLRWNPVDKIRLEYGKILFSEKRHREAADVLREITAKVNADWRAVYRSFYLLSEIYGQFGDRKEHLRYRALCSKCHPGYPLLNRKTSVSPRAKSLL